MEFIYVILEIILFILIVQISTITHELGHVLSALILTKENVKMTLGRNNETLKKIRLRRLAIELRGFHPFLGYVYLNESKLTRFQRMMIYAGGPIVSLVLGIVLSLISRNLEHELLKDIILFSGNYQLHQLVWTSIPIVYPKWLGGYGGYSSDGHNILKLIKANQIN